MFIKSGIPNRCGVFSLHNTRDVVEIDVGSKPEYSSYNKFPGEFVVTCYYDFLGEGYYHIFCGTLQECEREMESIYVALEHEVAVHPMSESEITPDNDDS